MCFRQYLASPQLHGGAPNRISQAQPYWFLDNGRFRVTLSLIPILQACVQSANFQNTLNMTH